MKRVPQCIEELIAQIGDLTATQQRAYHLMITKRMIETATVRQIHALRDECEISPLCEWLGEAHRLEVLDMIDGHLALRAMKLVRRQYLPRATQE